MIFIIKNQSNILYLHINISPQIVFTFHLGCLLICLLWPTIARSCSIVTKERILRTMHVVHHRWVPRSMRTASLRMRVPSGSKVGKSTAYAARVLCCGCQHGRRDLSRFRCNITISNFDRIIWRRAVLLNIYFLRRHSNLDKKQTTTHWKLL